MSSGFGDFDDGPWEPSPWSNGRDIRGSSRSSSMINSRGSSLYGGMNNSGNSWNGGGSHHSIHMRGLPFRANQSDIADVSFPNNFYYYYLLIIYKNIIFLYYYY